MVKNLVKSILIIFIVPSLAISAPVVSGVAGVLVDGQQVTVTGFGFGTNGPNVILFDDFNRGEEGQELSASATIGTWSKMKSVSFADSLISNKKGARCFNESGWLNNNTVVFGKVYSEVFISSIAYVPNGYYMPPNKGQGEDAWPSISCLKHFWFYYTATGYKTDNDPDLVGFCVNSSTSKYNLFANDYARATLNREDDFNWSWDEPVQLSMWIKGNGTSREGSDGMIKGVSSLGQSQKNFPEDFYKETDTWFSSTDNVFGFDRVTVPGFLTGTGDSKANYVVDDVYVAVGEDAAARVELGNASNYTACTKIAISTPDLWSDKQIVLTVREGTFKPDENVYLFVVDGNGDYSVGYGPLIMGQNIGDGKVIGFQYEK